MFFFFSFSGSLQPVLLAHLASEVPAEGVLMPIRQGPVALNFPICTCGSRLFFGELQTLAHYSFGINLAVGECSMYGWYDLKVISLRISSQAGPEPVVHQP